MHASHPVSHESRIEPSTNAASFVGSAHDHGPYQEDYFLATVIDIDRITPSMIRAVFRIAEGERLVASGHPDEWVRIAFQPDPATPLTLPTRLESGKWGRPDGSKHCPNRPYTIRYWQPSSFEMTVDFVIHEGGVASTWAINARIGDVVGICNPEGRFWLPEKTEWMLLLGDITALPAISRILEDKPASMPAIAHIEIPAAADRQDLDHVLNSDLTWHEWNELSFGDRTDLAAIARLIKSLPAGPGYIYIAGEATAVSECRKHFRDVLGFDKQRIAALGYWIEGQARV